MWVSQVTAAAEGGRARWASGKAALVEAIRDARAHGDHRRADECGAVLGAYLREHGEYAAAAEVYREVAESGSRRDDPQARLWGLLGQARLATLTGDLEAALVHAQAAWAIDTEALAAQDRAIVVQRLSVPIPVLLRTGRAEEGRRRAEQLLEMLSTLRPTAFYLSHSFVSLFEAFQEMLARSDSRPEDRGPLLDGARRACACLARYRRIFPIGEPALLRAQGALAHAEGRTDRAVSLWRSGLAAAERLEMAGEHALLCHLLAEALPAESPEAARHAAQAERAFAALGAHAELARLRGEAAARV
jgi:hypothetical protein